MPTTDGGALVLGGIGGTTFSTLSSVGSDLSISVSFSIASELLATANELQVKEDELIGVVLGFTVVMAAVEARLLALIRSRRATLVKSVREQALSEVQELRESSVDIPSLSLSSKQDASTRLKLNEKLLDAFVDSAVRAATERAETRRSLLDFAHLLVSIASRIGLAISIQLLAASVRAQQPSRLVRVISLTSLAAFFVFVEALAGRAVQ